MINKNDMINVVNIIDDSIVDGEGIRLVIFEQGCCHGCDGCHNPDTHSFEIKNLVSIDNIIERIENNPLLDGITLSGGDPFFQAKANVKLLKEVRKKFKDIDIWAYTGFLWEDFMNFKNQGIQPENKANINKDMIDMLRLCDIVVDGKFILELRTLDGYYKGSSNQRIIDVKKSLRKSNKAPVQKFY